LEGTKLLGREQTDSAAKEPRERGAIFGSRSRRGSCIAGTTPLLSGSGFGLALCPATASAIPTYFTNLVELSKNADTERRQSREAKAFLAQK